MGIFNDDLILPGTITEIESDYSFGYDTSLFGTTDSITIIGTAFNGPVGKAVPVYNPEHAKYLFGSIYDYKTKKEATLVAEILNAWDRGCKTIYAVRISGKQISKDFQLLTTNDLKLRVSGIFPSNENKDVNFVYDDRHGASTITLNKPAKKATIQEKMQGHVDKEDSVLTIKLDISNSYGLAKENRLTELIKIVNDHPHNNVIRLSIVDREGNDITYSSKDAQSVALGAMCPGAYFVGRDKNNCYANTDMSYEIASDKNTPYEGFTGKMFKKLMINSDISKDLPIYAEDIKQLNDSFLSSGVYMSTPFDFLTVPGAVDKIYGVDDIDYEEVDLEEFEIYNKLGSGFATTAKAEFRNDEETDIKVIETPVSDDNKIKPIQDGIYSMLENLDSKYRMLSVGNADSNIRSKTPRKEEFRISSAITSRIFEDMIEVTPKVESSDISQFKEYEFQLDFLKEDIGAEIIDKKLEFHKSIDEIAIAKVSEEDIEAGLIFTNAKGDNVVSDLKEGEIFLNLIADEAKLYRVVKGKMIQVVGKELNGRLFFANEVIYLGEYTEDDSDPDVDKKTELVFKETELSTLGAEKVIVINSEENVNLYTVETNDLDSSLSLKPVGLIDDVFSDDEDKTIVLLESVNTLQETKSPNKINIKSGALDYVSLEELVEMLNEHSTLKTMFKFSLTNKAIPQKDEYIIEDIKTKKTTVFTKAGFLPVESKIKDKSITYDTSLYIPYKTNDNFARQLAQHCTYTSLKTASTHGIIGTNPLVDSDLSAISKKVEDLTRLDLNLYAKKPNGRDMLDANNLPYPIGRNVSVVVSQYILSTGDGYNYVSNAAGGYIGMVSTLPIEQSSTNQPINIPEPMYEFTNHQLGLLSRQGFVTFKQSYTKGIVVTDGVTMAPVTSPFRRLSVARTIGTVEEIIRTAAEPFIGQQNHLANRNAMQTAIKSDMDKIQGRLIEEYNFNLVNDPAQARLGIIDIDYAIVPVYEITQIRNRISVKEKI